MTNINKNKHTEDMRMHIDKAYSKINNRLPEEYVNRVLVKLSSDKKLTSQIVRNIKNRITKYPKSRINVIIALVEVADEYENECRQLEKVVK